ncbi:hypothetical protein AB6A40_006792 [Gnathostoma spinigerum]|uniref:Uncharacterized protein n=1 Tax=Gnathostoma spinigerum TaxID=75299 RepID=A0ABD6ESS5_9BILA
MELQWIQPLYLASYPVASEACAIHAQILQGKVPFFYQELVFVHDIQAKTACSTGGYIRLHLSRLQNYILMK